MNQSLDTAPSYEIQPGIPFSICTQLVLQMLGQFVHGDVVAANASLKKHDDCWQL